MKEFSNSLDSIFGGLNPERVIKKKDPRLEECHNIEPLKEDYTLHSIIIDLNATDYDWHNNPDLIDYWTDNEDDDFIDHSDDDFIDI